MPNPTSLKIIALAAVMAPISAFAGTSVVGATATSPSVKETSGTSGWRIVDSVAKTATISFFSTAQVAGLPPVTSDTKEFKCAVVGGNVFGRTFDGSHVSTSNGSLSARVDVIGSSTVSTPPDPGVPTYYQAAWTSTTSTQGDGSSVFSGTYDPYTLTFGDLVAMGFHSGQSIDIFANATLQASTGISAGPGEVGSYLFDAYFYLGAAKIDLMKIWYDRDGSVYGTFGSVGTDPHVSVYDLGEDSDDDSLDPTSKLTGATLLTSSSLTTMLQGNLDHHGRTKCVQGFGFVYTGYVLPTFGADGDPVFESHVDTVVQMNPVPEPSSLVVVGLGLVFSLRRRAKR